MNDPKANQPYRDERIIWGSISSPPEHFVEDARTKKDNPAPVVNKKRKRRKTGKLFTIAITILCFSATLIAADILSGHASASDYVAIFKTQSKNDSHFYAVYATYSEDMSVSYKNATALRAEGAAGYVLKDDGKYYVILNVYASKEDAQKIIDRQADYGMYEIHIPNLDIRKASFGEYAEGTETLYLQAYELLYECANNLTSGKYGEEDMLRELEKYKQELSMKEEIFAERVKGKEDTAIIEYKVILAEIRSAFENLLSGREHLASNARYYCVMILHHYALFAEKYF